MCEINAQATFCELQGIKVIHWNLIILWYLFLFLGVTALVILAAYLHVAPGLHIFLHDFLPEKEMKWRREEL